MDPRSACDATVVGYLILGDSTHLFVTADFLDSFFEISKSIFCMFEKGWKALFLNFEN